MSFIDRLDNLMEGLARHSNEGESKAEQFNQAVRFVRGEIKTVVRKVEDKVTEIKRATEPEPQTDEERLVRNLTHFGQDMRKGLHRFLKDIS